MHTIYSYSSKYESIRGLTISFFLVLGTLSDKDYLTTDILKDKVNKIYNDREK